MIIKIFYFPVNTSTLKLFNFMLWKFVLERCFLLPMSWYIAYRDEHNSHLLMWFSEEEKSFLMFRRQVDFYGWTGISKADSIKSLTTVEDYFCSIIFQNYSKDISKSWGHQRLLSETGFKSLKPINNS